MPAPIPSEYRNKKDSLILFPAQGNYNRLPLDPEGDGFFSYKVAETKDRNGNTFYLVFMDPNTSRDENRTSR